MNYLLPDWQHEEKLEHVPTRDGYGKALVALGEKHEEVVALSADLTESTRAHWFAEKFPNRFFNTGVAEQNLVGVASGLAAVGKRPFISSYAVFNPGLSWLQIRTTVTYNNQPIVIAGGHAGLTAGPDGATHQALEDIALMRTLPNMIVLSPADAHEAYQATQALMTETQPAYIRLGRAATPVFTQPEYPFELGKVKTVREGVDVTLVATGPLVYSALLAAEQLQAKGVSVEVLNCHTIKPLDWETIVESLQKTNTLMTLEEHQVAGGMGSAVLEKIADVYPVPTKMLGISDRYGQSGHRDDLLQEYHLTVEHIVEAVRVFVSELS